MARARNRNHNTFPVSRSGSTWFLLCSVFSWLPLTWYVCSVIFSTCNHEVITHQLSQTIVATSVPAITNDFHGIKDQAWYAAAFFLTAGGCQSTWGKIYQNFPLKLSFLTAIFIFEVGSLICAVAPSSAVFIAGRVIAGIGSSGVGSGSYTIVAFIVEPKKRANYTAMLGAIFGIGSILGPSIGGAFAADVTWRW